MFLLRSVGATRLATFEGCVHNGLRDKGFPAPRVWLAADNTPEVGSVLVMDFVDGAPVMAAGGAHTVYQLHAGCIYVCVMCDTQWERLTRVCDCPRAMPGWPERIQKGAAILPLIRSLQLTFVEMPFIVGTAAGSLHNTRPDRVLERLAASGLKPTDVHFKAWLGRYKPRVEAIAASVCPSFGDMYAWLVRNYRPAMDDPETAVVCHGDLFPPNILMRRDAAPGSPSVVPVAGVIDWSCAVVTTPAFDVGVCQGGFEGAHVSCPAVLRWLVNMVKRGIGGRFVRRYCECTAHVPGTDSRWRFDDADVAYFKVVRYLFAMTPFLEARIEGYQAQRYLLSLPPKAENEYMDGMCQCVRAITGVCVRVPVLAVPQVPSSCTARACRCALVTLIATCVVLAALWCFARAHAAT